MLYGDEAIVSTVVDVSSVGTRVVVRRRSRRRLILSNASDHPVWIHLGSTFEPAGAGLVLPVGGHPVTLEYQGPATAIHDGEGVKRVGVIEL